ncbi:MAG: general secretion pathway protein GspD [Blastopirellula sp.]|nr:MAG: general secretion pathway protein GspD [Blastopirellula sp.]
MFGNGFPHKIRPAANHAHADQTRRVALNFAARVLTSSLAVAVLITAGHDLLANPIVEIQLLSTTVSSGQNFGNQSAVQQQQALLKQARQAMRENDFLKAENFIAQASKLNVQSDPIFSKFQDTPEQAWASLVKLKAAQPASALINRSQFAGQGQTPITPNFGNPAQPTRLPAVAATSYNQFGQQNAGLETGKKLLLDARRELAQGNTALAARYAAQANNLGVIYSANEDSPAIVDTLIRKTVQINQGRRDEFTKNRFGELLLEQADGLIAYNQIAEASSLIQQAEFLNNDYSRSKYTPQLLKNKITQRLRSPVTMPSAVGPIASTGQTGSLNQEQALLIEAKLALGRGNILQAEQMAAQAKAMNVPDTYHRNGDILPELMIFEISKAKSQLGGVRQASNFAGTPGLNPYPVAQGVYNPGQDLTQTRPASATSDINPAYRYISEGEQSLLAGDRQKARDLFVEAWKFEGNLDPKTRQRLQEHLQLRTPPVTTEVRQVNNSPLEEVDAKQQVLLKQIVAEVTQEQSMADRMRESDPKSALSRLMEMRSRVDQSALDSNSKKQLLSRLDRSAESIEAYIRVNGSQIELDATNAAIKQRIRDERNLVVETSEQIAGMVDQFNELMDQQRWAEAEVIARQARELAPLNPVVQTLIWKSIFARRMANNMQIRDDKENNTVIALSNADLSSTPFDDNNPYQFNPNVREWGDLTARRQKFLERSSRLTEDELRIQEALKTKVDVNFEKQPLQTVMDTLANMAGINVRLDSLGLAHEGVTYSTEVTIKMQQPIMLKSALNHILQPLRLSYVIQDEALKIISETQKSEDLYTETYNVADLVIPIPNFIPSYDIGLPGAIKAAYETIGYGGGRSAAPVSPLAFMAGGSNLNNTSVMAQNVPGMLPGMRGSGQVQSGQPQGMGFGSGGGMGGGMGGNVQPDFDALIELISSTIEPESWEELGGPGAIKEFDTNLSLVISQTQEVHDKITDLLEQLRRLQDLQVTIEVRFITLNDNFFERIGVDFDFDIKDNTVGPGTNRDNDGSPSVTFGLDNQGDPTSDFDLSFAQNTFGNTIPSIGGFGAGAGNVGATFGFAMLSDIEAFFVMQAAQGDLRSNVMQAPKVTLFNGQVANVSDTTQRPFVTSVIPVVGDFAAAQQPVIVVLNEGTSLSVQAVVSPDRRFVRLTLVPFFSTIGNVEEFTFEGTTTSRTDTSSVNPDATDGGESGEIIETTTSGSTVQQPEFSFITVRTTVSVPDGGTVLLGGIKRLSEERRERGIPVMSKIPYINRLFRNVGIGRETQSLMMMVTPRIIIQEEEEENLGLGSN